VVLHLLDVPAGAHAEQEAPAGDVVEGGDLLGGHDRIALDDEADARADLQALGRGGGGGEAHERVDRVAVLGRELAATGVRGGAADRDMSVLWEEERLEAELLRGPPELGGRHPIVGGEVG
jgi:hypothetical protein